MQLPLSCEGEPQFNKRVAICCEGEPEFKIFDPTAQDLRKIIFPLVGANGRLLLTHHATQMPLQYVASVRKSCIFKLDAHELRTQRKDENLPLLTPGSYFQIRHHELRSQRKNENLLPLAPTP